MYKLLAVSMKNLKIILLIIFFLAINKNCFAQNNYSINAIEIYNSGVALHKQHSYDMAEQKYLKALKIQPNFVEAKKNLSMVYHYKAQKYYGQGDYNEAIIYTKKALSLSPEKFEYYNTLANCYAQMKDYVNAIEIYNKILSKTPDDDNVLNNLAIAYMKTNQNEKAQKVYNDILLINPEDKVAQQNLKYISYRNNEQILNNSINNLPSVSHAPNSLYKLIKPSAGITKNTVDKTKYILDLIWSEPNGQILLKAILNKKIPINITQGIVTANAMQQTKKNTLMLYGFIPIFSYDTSSMSVNIAFNYISDFYNPNIDPRHRIYDLQIFLHEFGHAFMYCKNLHHQDAIEEELGVSIIGFDSAYKIITGQYLTKEQTEEYSMQILQALLSDSHRNLPVYNGFNKEIQYYGIKLPYPEIYSNLPLMYKKLLSESKISPVPNFYVYVKCKY